jgi:hypothetical protein
MSVRGAPPVAVSQTAPNTHPTVIISSDRRNDQKPGRVHGHRNSAEAKDNSDAAWSSSQDEVERFTVALFTAPPAAESARLAIRVINGRRLARAVPARSLP